MKISSHIFFALLFVMTACSKTESPDTIAFKTKVDVPNNFPIHEQCDTGMILDLDIIGIREAACVDSVLIVYTAQNEKAYKVVDLRSGSVIGEMADMGHGPKEFTFIPGLSQASIMRQNGSSILSLPDNVARKRHNYDLTVVISGQADCDSVVANPEIDNYTIYQGLFADGIEFRIDLNPDECRIARTVSVDGKHLNIEAVDWLNHFSVDNVEKIGLLMPTVALSADEKKVVEIYNGYPQINLYSISDGWKMTLAPDGKTEGYAEYDGKSADFPTMIYRSVKAYKDFFVVNKVGTDDTAELQFFDWHGKPLMSLTIPYAATSFDIDFSRDKLLTVNFLDETVREYEIGAFLKKLGSK